jgi:hypothetical protein
MTYQEQIKSLQNLQDIHTYLGSICGINKPVYIFICDINIIDDKENCIYEKEDTKGIINIDYNGGSICFPDINEKYYSEYKTMFQYFEYDNNEHILKINGEAAPPKKYKKYTLNVSNYRTIN